VTQKEPAASLKFEFANYGRGDGGCSLIEEVQDQGWRPELCFGRLFGALGNHLSKARYTGRGCD